ncbi:unannotated protein [freshwater metagenome]|uniref:Unannotated protein n=1 Tax=freshwater metagenome TaxID=449393 RepID=A0A6J7EQC7_9ZZZZ
MDARGQNHDRWVGDVSGCRRAKGLEEAFWVLADRADPVSGEDLGKDVGERAAILEDVGDPRRIAEVVLEYEEGALLVANQVDAGDVNAHAVGGLEPPGLAMEVRR